MYSTRFCGGGESTPSFSTIETLEPRRLLAAANVLGSLDPSFSRDGQAFATFAGVGSANSVAVQSDGKVVIAGWQATNDDSDRQFAIARFNPDGSPDQTFGTHGLVTLDPLARVSGATDLGTSQAEAVGVTAAGQILVAGVGSGTIANSADATDERGFAVVVRLKKNGSIDTTYGTNGVAWTDFEDVGFSIFNAMSLTSNGSAIVAGETNGGAVVAKFDPTGQLDTSFNQSGFNRFIVIGEDDAELTALTVAKDGSIYATGDAGPDQDPGNPIGVIAEEQSDIALAKLTSSGELADGFGADDNGRFAVDTSVLGPDANGQDDASAIFLDPQSRVVIGGTVSIQDGEDFAIETSLLRFDSNGLPDDTWGTGGILAFATNSREQFINVGAAAAYGSGRYLVAGSDDAEAQLFSISSKTGAVDTTFGSAGFAGIKHNAVSTAIGFGHDGSIFVATGELDSGFVTGIPQELAGVFKLRAAPGTVSGIAYNDVNGDGTIETGDTPAAAQQVYLDFDSDGQRESNEPIVSVDKNGKFTLPNIGPGSYELRMVLPAGTRLSSSTLGYRRVSVVSSQTTASQRLLFTTRALISGTVFDDLNEDGVQEIADDENGLENWPLLVDLNGNGVADKGEPEILTDANGNFVLPSLTPGKYPLRVLIESDGVATTPVERAVRVTAGQVVTEVKFGVAL